MLCIGSHLGHNDEEVTKIADQIDKWMTDLNERFEDRRAAIGERLLTHKTHIDTLFDVYYWALDDMKSTLLSEENKLLDELSKMEMEFEKLSQSLFA